MTAMVVAETEAAMAGEVTAEATVVEVMVALLVALATR